MDSNTLDSVARALGSGQSRRRLMKRLASAALGAGAAAIGFGQTDARFVCRGEGVACSRNADCCSQFCNLNGSTGRRVCAVPICSEPSAGSSYGGSCYGAAETCTAEGTILSAQCQVADYPWNYVPTSINVNNCQAQGYVISNCNGALTCGNC